MMATKSYYNTLLCQVFSPQGNHLVVGDIYGYINVFNLEKILNPGTTPLKLDRAPVNTFLVHANIQINSLLTTESYLLVGTVGEIVGYSWTNVINCKDAKPTWKIEIPNSKDTFEKVDINCLVYDNKLDILYAGCCDNFIHAINIEAQKIAYSLKGHTNYIHSMANTGNDLISGGEDGLVNIWDQRCKSAVHTFEPWQNAKVHRPELGKWIGAVSMNDDWLVCGGGPRLSLWHFRSLNMSSVFPIDDKGIHVAQFLHGKILAGGRSKYFYQMNINGDIKSEIPVSSISIYCAAYQEEPYTALCLCGSSPNIDICSNLNYRDQVLSLGDLVY